MFIPHTKFENIFSESAIENNPGSQISAILTPTEIQNNKLNFITILKDKSRLLPDVGKTVGSVDLINFFFSNSYE